MGAQKIDTEEVIKTAESYYKALFRKETYEHDCFDPTRYKWVIGHKAFAALEAAVPMKMAIHEAPTLFSIPVDISLINTKTIEIWENITEKL